MTQLQSVSFLPRKNQANKRKVLYKSENHITAGWAVSPEFGAGRPYRLLTVSGQAMANHSIGCIENGAHIKEQR